MSKHINILENIISLQTFYEYCINREQETGCPSILYHIFYQQTDGSHSFCRLPAGEDISALTLTLTMVFCLKQE